MAERLEIIITADARNAVAGFKRVTKSTETMSKKVRASSRGMSLGMRRVGIAAGVAGIAIGVKAVSQAANFSRAMAEVSTLLDLSDSEMKTLTGRVREMSVLMGTDAVETARGLYSTISAGVTDADDAMALLAIATKTSIAGLTTQEIAVNAITTVMDAYGLGMEEAEGIADTLFTTVRLGKTRFEELAHTIGRVTAVAAPAGITFEEVGAAMAVLTKQLGGTDIASTALKSSIAAMLSPSAQMTAVAKKAGVQIGLQALEGKGLTGVLDALAKLYNKNKQAVINLFPNQRALIGMLALSSNNAKAFTNAMGDMENKEKSMSIAFEKMNESASRQFEIFKSQLNDVMIETGNAVIPGLISAMEGLKPVLADISEAVKENDQTWRDLGEGIGIAAKAATGFFGILGKIGGAVGEAFGKVDVAMEEFHLKHGLNLFGRLDEKIAKRGLAFAVGAEIGEAITPEQITAARSLQKEGSSVVINTGVNYIDAPNPLEQVTDRGSFNKKVAER